MHDMTEQEWHAFVMTDGSRSCRAVATLPVRGAQEFGARNATAGELLVRLRPEHVLARAGLAD